MHSDGKKIGLALSGGGYRAAAYHLGTMRALNKLGILDKIDVLSSVSGGSITAAYYVLNQSKGYEEFEREFRGKLKHGVLCTAVINLLVDIGVIIVAFGLTPTGYKWITLVVILLILFFIWYHILPVSALIARQYDRIFFQKAKLNELPPRPILAINTTDLSTGNQFTFSQEKMVCFPYEDEYKLRFSTVGFPLSRAVMASSCIPQIFSPVRISSKYYIGTSKKKPLLVDGGLYDNQGAHKFNSHDDYFNVSYAIVSDAGNTVMSSKWDINPLFTLLSSANIMMRRIKNFQRQHNSYVPSDKKKVIFAYNDLMWNDYDSMVDRFVDNIKRKYIPENVLRFHGITNEQVENMRAGSDKAQKEIQSRIEANINWHELLNLKPKKHDIAKKVGTNLVGLSDKKIDALIEHAEWLTEVQVRLHLPFLITEKT